MTKIKGLDLSVRLRHPTLKAEEITVGMNVTPTGFQQVGSPRKSVVGTALKGEYVETYWHYHLLSSIVCDLSEAVEKANVWLQKRRNFTDQFVGVGGVIDYYVSVSSSSHLADELSVELIKTCADLGVKIGFEIYFDK